jgi:hypothetical protein
VLRIAPGSDAEMTQPIVLQNAAAGLAMLALRTNVPLQSAKQKNIG